MSEFKVKGKLIENPELKIVKDDIKVMNIALSVDKKVKVKEGEKTSYYEPYTLWEKNAEKFDSDKAKKGDVIELSGTMVPRRYDVLIDGSKVSKTVYEPRVEKVKVLERSKETSNENNEELAPDSGKTDEGMGI